MISWVLIDFKPNTGLANGNLGFLNVLTAITVGSDSLIVSEDGPDGDQADGDGS